jgi:hypothetical protein
MTDHLTIPRAIVLAAIIVALAIVFIGRWEISGQGGAVARLDKWTGTVALCRPGMALACQ